MAKQQPKQKTLSEHIFQNGEKNSLLRRFVGIYSDAPN